MINTNSDSLANFRKFYISLSRSSSSYGVLKVISGLCPSMELMLRVKGNKNNLNFAADLREESAKAKQGFSL